MANEDVDPDEQALMKWGTGVLLLAMAAVIGWIVFNNYLKRPDRMDDVEKMPKTHPVFGPIFLTSATDLTTMRRGRDARGNPVFIAPEQLLLGTNRMQWTVPGGNKGGRSGILYVWGAFPSTNNYWTVAPCPKHDLADVTAKDLETEFVGMNDDVKGRALFKGYWISSPSRGRGAGLHALVVKEGDILLLRPVSDPTTTYALEFTRQNDSNLKARYVKIEK